MYGLPDYLDYHLKIVFVGYNPGEKSAKLNYHYAGRGNQFWRLLFDSGLTTRLYSPEEDHLLLQEGYGLTNIVSRPSKSSSDLTKEEMCKGAMALRKKIENYKPRIVCFLGKEIYRLYIGLKSSIPISYGIPAQSHLFHQTRAFVAPNPSARSTIPYDRKLDYFVQLRSLLNHEGK